MRRGKILLLIVTLMIVALVIYLRHHRQTLEIITLEPGREEYKKKPVDPGGIVIPHSNSLIYEQLKGGSNEAVQLNTLSEPELPLNIIYNQSTGDKLFSSIDEILDNIGYFEQELSQDVKSNDSFSDFIMPDTVLAKNPHNEFSSLSKDATIQNTQLNFVNISDGKKLDYLKINKRAEEGGYKIQLGVAFSENEAKKVWDNIKQKHSTILKDASLVLRKIEGNNERIFYLVIAGTYTSLSTAKLVCNKLSSRHQNCIITK